MRILTLLATLLFVATTAFSQNIFIKYDETCMDRYEYQLGANNSGRGFITYHVKLDNGAKVILEVGPESIRNRKRLPKGVKTCKNAGFSQRMVDRINSKQLKVYLVRKDDKRYNFSPVGLAAYVQEADGAISYRTKSYNFDYNVKKNTTGQDLANSASNSEVYLEGTSPYVCSNSYLFRKIPRLVCYAYTDIIYIPEVGIVEERTGRTVEEAEKNKLKLIAINDQPFEQYYANVVCPQPTPAEPAIVAAPDPVKPAFVPTEFTDKTPTVSYGWIARNQPEVLTERTPQENAILLDKIGERRVEFVQADPEYGLIALAEEDTPVVYEFTEKTVTETIPNPCEMASAPGVHIVQREETLYGISRQYGASVDQLRVWNKLGNQDLIYPCMQLYIIPPSTFNPTVVEKETPKGDCAESSFAGIHIVQKGETLYGIGRQYGLSISDLRKWNNLDNINQLSPCMRIATAQPEQVLPVTNPVPNTAAEPITVTTVPSSAPTFDDLAAKGVEVPGVVVVKRGETLYQIARANSLNVNQLRQWNKLNSDTLTPGQVLYTTAPDTTPQPYDQTGSRIDPGVKANAVLVKPGESLYQIAKDNNITIQNLRDWNNLTTDVLKAGQVLFITAPETTVITTTTANYVTVQKGQTLYQIARDNNLTVANLRAWNNLKSDQLQPDQMIYIVAPTVVPQSFDQTVPLTTDKNVKITCLESSRPGVHVVQPGETLYEISRIHNITVQQLQGWNRLQAGDVLEPCTKLATIAPQSDVPSSYDTTAKGGKTGKCKKKSTKNLHIVQAGETLYQLSQKYNVRVAQLQAWNGLGSSTYLAPCTELAITQPASYVINQSPKVASPPQVIQEPKVTTQTTVQTKPRVPVIVAPQPTPRTPIIVQEPAPQQVITKIICEQSSSPGTHIVQQGETLVQIAAIHRVTANQLRAWNNLRATDIIQACQALNTRPVTTNPPPAEYNVVVVPTPQPAQDQLVTKTITTRRILHTVKKGETLGSIAAKYNITVIDLLNFNQLPNNTIIFIGQQLYASAPQAVDQITQPTPTTNTAANAQMPAGVQPDVPVSFDNSAQRINPNPAPATTTTTTTPAATITTTTTVVPAEVFTNRSPEPATYETTVAGRKRVHIVQDGETIESIAKLYGVSPSRIRSENLLDERDIVIPLQKIYIVK